MNSEVDFLTEAQRHREFNFLILNYPRAPRASVRKIKNLFTEKEMNLEVDSLTEAQGTQGILFLNSQHPRVPRASVRKNPNFTN